LFLYKIIVNTVYFFKLSYLPFVLIDDHSITLSQTFKHTHIHTWSYLMFNFNVWCSFLTSNLLFRESQQATLKKFGYIKYRCSQNEIWSNYYLCSSWEMSLFIFILIKYDQIFFIHFFNKQKRGVRDLVKDFQNLKWLMYFFFKQRNLTDIFTKPPCLYKQNLLVLILEDWYFLHFCSINWMALRHIFSMQLNS